MFIDRKQSLLKVIKENGAIKVSNLIANFDSSPATIRRDLTTLEKEKVITRSYGVVRYTGAMEDVLPYETRTLTAGDDKLRVARVAASLILNHQTIFLDSGSTTLLLAKQLLDRKLTIITNAIDIVQTLSKTKNQVICCGGILQGDDPCLVGRDAVSFIEKIEVDLAFIGATAVRSNCGLATSSPFQYDLKRAIIKSSHKKYGVFDISKFNCSSLYLFANFSDLTGIITNRPLYNSTEEKLLNEVNHTDLDVILV